MKRIFPQLFAPTLRHSYVTTTPTTDLGITTNTPTNKVPQVKVPQQKVQAQSDSSIIQRAISTSSGQGSIPVQSTSSIPTPQIPPLPFVDPTSIKFLYKSQIQPDFDQTSQILKEESHKDQRYYYNSLLSSAVKIVLSKSSKSSNFLNSDDSIESSLLISELSVKKIFSRNEEMKKVILKVAAMALAQQDGGGFGEALHPFINTAGEVFFGANYTSEELQESSNSVQDILTPGILILLLDKLVTRNYVSPGANVGSGQLGAISDKHLLLAKALVETTAGYLIHRTVQETNHLMSDTSESSRHFETMHQGNKLATLTGDLLVVSLIKNVACTGNNKVLELVMNSLSEFSTTEMTRTQKPFDLSTSSTPLAKVYKALLPQTLAESVVFSKGFESSVLLTGIRDPSTLEWASRLGSLMGLLWKTNFDLMKLTGDKQLVENISELNQYLSNIRDEADNLLTQQNKIYLNQEIASVFRQLIYFWGQSKRNLL